MSVCGASNNLFIVKTTRGHTDTSKQITIPIFILENTQNIINTIRLK